jgi:hypothetical protein
MSDVVEHIKKKRNRFKQTQTLEERLAADTEQMRERLKSLPPGPTRDHVERRIVQNEAAKDLSELLRL